MLKVIITALLLSSLLRATPIPEDKQKHATAGVLIYATCEAVNYFVTDESIINHTSCMGVVALAAIGKEVYDSMGHGDPDALDAAATLAIPLVSFTILEW